MEAYLATKDLNALNVFLKAGMKRVVLENDTKIADALGIKANQVLFEYNENKKCYSLYGFKDGEKVSEAYNLNFEAYEMMDNFPKVFESASQGAKKNKEENKTEENEDSKIEENKTEENEDSKIEDNKANEVTLTPLSDTTSLDSSLTFTANSIINNFQLDTIFINSEADSLYSKIKDFIIYLEEDVKSKMEIAISGFSNLYPELQKQLTGKSYGEEFFITTFNSILNDLGNNLGEIANNLETTITKMQEQDSKSSSTRKGHYSNINTSGDESNLTDTTTLVQNNQVETISLTDITSINTLVQSIIGGVTFKEITSLYDSNLNLTNGQAQLEREYILVDKFTKDDIEYGKIYDTINNKFYYIRLSDVNVDTTTSKIEVLKQEIFSLLPAATIETLTVLNSLNTNISFKEIVLLSETIGGSTIEASLTGNYQLFQIIKIEDQYYLQIYDLDNNKFYYCLANDLINITDNPQFIEILDNTMLLTSTEIGTNNFSKLADPNTLYHLEEIITENDLTFYKVLDSEAKTYYIPKSDTNKIISLEDIINHKEDTNE